MTKRIDRPCEFVVRILILGWGCPLPRETRCVSALPRETQAELAELWRLGLAGLADLWRTHEPFLRAEAKRLAISPRYSYGSKPVYFGELIAAGTPPATPRPRLAAGSRKR